MTRPLFLRTLIAGSLASLCALQAHADAAPAAAAARPAASAPAAADPYLVVQDTYTYVLAEPGAFLARARDQLRAHHPAAAARDLRDSARMMDNLARDAAGDDKAALVREANALRDVAKEVSAHRIATPAQLDGQLASTRAALARHHLVRATEAWARKDYAAAGTALSAAAHYVETGMRSFSHESVTDVEHAARYGDRLAHRGASAVAGEFDRARDAVGQGITALGSAIEAHRPA